MPGPLKRAILIVLDGVGCGELPDAPKYGDPGSDTLGNLSRAYPALRLPNLARWGAGHLTNMPNVPRLPLDQCVASVGRCGELSNGKDTTSGHWEMAGGVVETAFATFPQGFPKEIVERWCRENNLPGVLGNCTASGTEIITKLGEEHMRTGKPILYTSADSVWQIAAHEESFGLDRLNKIGESARRLCDELQISRVITRPFVGKTAADFKRTYHRHDYSQTPPFKTMMEYVLDAGLPSVGVGKIWNIFNGRGVQDSLETEGNTDGLKTLEKALSKYDRGLIFVNLIDFDMLYGHRRDVPGFAKALEEFDAFLPVLESRLSADDLVVISADHGNDPTYRGTDHTREYVPLLAYRKGAKAKALGNRGTFADIGQTIAHALTGNAATLGVGQSFLPELL
ncbi:MAG: phosphopentomutase [Deltaproteobacteria bacterium]|nr:phosphopentomutase [Deltaproteobacteria bacterium]